MQGGRHYFSKIMFGLLRGLWEYWFRRDEYVILILGLDNAGKTVSNFAVVRLKLTARQTLLERFKVATATLAPRRVAPTVGVNGW